MPHVCLEYQRPSPAVHATQKHFVRRYCTTRNTKRRPDSFPHYSSASVSPHAKLLADLHDHGFCLLLLLVFCECCCGVHVTVYRPCVVRCFVHAVETIRRKYNPSGKGSSSLYTAAHPRLQREKKFVHSQNFVTVRGTV